MDQHSLTYVKTIVRSILTSYPGQVTISQLLHDYDALEGQQFPFKELGFNNIYEALENMNDVLRMQPNPNMNSYLQIIVSDKTEHLREFVMSQKTRKPKAKRYSSCTSNYHTSNGKYFQDNDHRRNNNSRGYDHVKTSSSYSLQNNGLITNELRSSVENLFISNQCVPISTLKTCLLNHPDYSKLNTTNIEDALNKLKFFIYINNMGVHLKSSSFKISPHQQLKTTINTNPPPVSMLVVDDGDEVNINLDDEFGMDESMMPSSDDNADDDEYSMKRSNEKLYKLFPAYKGLKELQFKTEPKKSENLLQECIKHKNAIISIVSNSKNKPITVSQVFDEFKIIYGYEFPLQDFACNEVMEFVKRCPSLFILDDAHSVNSIIRLAEQVNPDTKNAIRLSIVNAALDKYVPDEKPIDFNLILNEVDSEPSPNNPANNSSLQEPNECTDNVNDDENYLDFEKYDADTILDTMKIKMRRLLIKHKNGIICDEFMDIYAKEFNTWFTFTEYGFNSMRDMAYNLPSVFYVKGVEYGEYFLFHASRRKELKDNDLSFLNGKIPETVLHNLSIFFDKHRYGVRLDDMMNLYQSEFNESYDVLKFGYSSEKHMFKSLNNMIAFNGDILTTLESFEYSYDDDEDSQMHEGPLPLATDLLLDYTGSDVCNGKFVYPNFDFVKSQKFVTVIMSEIYSPTSFYLQTFSEVDKLNNFMDSLQTFYDMNEEKYKVAPELLILGLACALRFENTNQWHRAKILKILDNCVQVFYVDYGSIESIPKSNVRLLATQFGDLPVQAIHCTLFEDDHTVLNHCEVNLQFAAMVDEKILEAEFKLSTIPTDPAEKTFVKLLHKTDFDTLNINELCSIEIEKYSQRTNASIRRSMLDTYMGNELKHPKFNVDTFDN